MLNENPQIICTSSDTGMPQYEVYFAWMGGVDKTGEKMVQNQPQTQYLLKHY